MIEFPTIYLPGHNFGEPQHATPLSAGYDMPAVLTRPCLRADDRAFLNWQGHRHDAWKMPAEPTMPRKEFDNVFEWLRDMRPAEIPKIKQMKEFPANHLHLKIQPGETIRVPLGIKTRMPPDKLCYLFARASSAKKDYRLGNCVGVIDADYPGEWYAAIRNSGTQVLVIQNGQRLVQAVPANRIEVSWRGVKQHEDTQRQGGFGSTGDAAISPDAALTGQIPKSEAVNMAQNAGPQPPQFEEPEPMTEAGRAVQDMLEEADPQEDAALDAAIAEEERRLMAGVDVANDQSDSFPDEVSPASDNGTVWEMNLVCGDVSVGPVAKFRPEVHAALYESGDRDKIVAQLQQEARVLLPRVFPTMIDQLMQRGVPKRPDA